MLSELTHVASNLQVGKRHLSHGVTAAVDSLTYMSEHSNELDHSYDMNSLLFFPFWLLKLTLRNLVLEINFYKFFWSFKK